MPLPLDISPPVFLAPMAGITDLPFRKVVSQFGAGMVVSEMVASQELLSHRPGTREKAELGTQFANTAVQLAGREAAPMAEAAKRVADMGARIIDINMGCPAKKVTQGLSGSALMRTPDHALSLIEAVVNAVDLPVTLKTRLGWDDEMLNAPQIARAAENAGIQMITIHGRTRCQFYKGHADWSAIAETKAAVEIPVIANGDILNAASAQQALQASGADGVMVGRGVRGKPWLLSKISTALFDTPPPQILNDISFVDLVSAHYEDILMFYGKALGVRVARKHLGWYMDQTAPPATLRKTVLTAKDPQDVLQLLPEALCQTLNRSAA